MTKKVNAYPMNSVIKCAVKPHLAEKYGTQPSKFAKFLQDGHMVEDRMVVWYREGDGAKYGWKSDASLLADASHYGFKAVKLKG